MKISYVNNFSNINRTKNQKSFKQNFDNNPSNGQYQESFPEFPNRYHHDGFGFGDFLYFCFISHILIATPLLNKLQNYALDKELKKYEIPAPKNDDLKKLIDNPKYSKAFYQLSKLRNIDKPDVTKIADDTYLAKLKLDDKLLAITMFTGELDKNKLSGVVVDGEDIFEYSATIHPEDIKTIEVEFSSFNDTLSNKPKVKKVFVRDISGELSIVENGKKTVINKQAAECFDMVKYINSYRIDLNRDYDESRDDMYLLGIMLTLLKMRIKNDDDEEMRRREKLKI